MGGDRHRGRRWAVAFWGTLLLAGCRMPEDTPLARWAGPGRSGVERAESESELRRLAPPETDTAIESGRFARTAKGGPADDAPRVRLASFLREEPLVSPDPAQLAPSPWIEEVPAPEFDRAAGGEFTLDEAIQMTLQGNPDLASASARLSMAGATLDRARAEFYPKLGISENYGVTNNPVYAFMYQLNQGNLSLTQDFNNPPTIDNFQTQVRLEHRVYAGEQRLHEEHAAEAGVSAAAQSLQAIQNQLVYGVAEAYYRLMQARDLVEVRQEAVSQVEQHLEIVQSRFRNDTAVKSDVLTVQVRLAEVREALITAQNQLELAWAVLQNVTGTPIEPRAASNRNSSCTVARSGRRNPVCDLPSPVRSSRDRRLDQPAVGCGRERGGCAGRQASRCRCGCRLRSVYRGLCARQRQLLRRRDVPSEPVRWRSDTGGSLPRRWPESASCRPSIADCCWTLSWRFGELQSAVE